MNVKTWEDHIQETIDVLEEQRKAVTDRMGLASSTTASINALLFSIKGWRQWFGNYQITNMLSGEDLVEIELTLYVVVKKLLEMDIKMTSKYKPEKIITADHGVFDGEQFLQTMGQKPRDEDERYIS
jgi:hypothetical protein